MNNTRLLKYHFTCWGATLRSRAKQDGKEKVAKLESITTPGSTSNKTATSSNSKKAERQNSMVRGSPDKENRRPNVLLKPLSEKKRPNCWKSTPKSVLDMQKRGLEREQRRKALKEKYAEAVAHKREHEEEDLKKKEEQESIRQNEYFKQRALEEGRKQAAVARRKQAFRLALLHYKMTLQRRIFNQWSKIFHIMTFNEQKVSTLGLGCVQSLYIIF